MTALPAELAIYLYRGDAWSATLSAAVDGVPETIDPATVLAQIRRKRDDATVLATFDVSVTGAVLTLSLDEGATGGLPVGTSVWDLQVGDETWLTGPVQVTADVSRA